MGSLVVAFAVGFLYVHTQPTTAGTDPLSSNGGEAIADVEKEFSNPSSDKDSDAKTAIASNGTPTMTGKEALTEAARLLSDAEARLEKEIEEHTSELSHG